jgi:hypothetical protein
VILTALVLGAFTANAAGRCEGIFIEGPYHEEALAAALAKATPMKPGSGLSSRDLDFLVENIFNKKEGRRHQVSEYWKKSVHERTLKIVERQVSEAVTKEGLLDYFSKHGLLVEKSRIRTKLEIVNRSPSFNILSALWSGVATLKGAPPVLLPEGSFKLKPADFNTLLLKGVNSAEGKALMARYQVRLEINRGYDLFSRYYTRIALAVLLYVVYDKTQDYLDQRPSSEGETSFEQILLEVEKMFGSDKKNQTKEDILFETVVKNFKEKYSRLPDNREMDIICLKVYGSSGCP